MSDTIKISKKALFGTLIIATSAVGISFAFDYMYKHVQYVAKQEAIAELKARTDSVAKDEQADILVMEVAKPVPVSITPDKFTSSVEPIEADEPLKNDHHETSNPAEEDMNLVVLSELIAVEIKSDPGVLGEAETQSISADLKLTDQELVSVNELRLLLAKPDPKPEPKAVVEVNVENVIIADKRILPENEADEFRYLAESYEQGIGVSQSDQKAFFWHRKAAQSGSPQSQHAVAVFYMNGTGTPKDVVKGIYWYKEASDQGFAASQHNLGAHFDKLGEKEEAFKYYMMSAKQNTAVDQFNVAVLYLKGEGVEHDKEEGLKWLKKAADNGDKQAISILAVS